jgi:hypothetical protein
MSDTAYRRTFVISVPKKRRKAFADAVRLLRWRYPLLTRSAIIVGLVRDPDQQLLQEMHQEQEAEAVETPPSGLDKEDIATHIRTEHAAMSQKDAVGVSIPPDQQEAFYTALATLEQTSSFASKSALIVDLVIQVGKTLADTESTLHARQRQEDDAASDPQARTSGSSPAQVAALPPNYADVLRTFPAEFQTHFYRGETAALYTRAQDILRILASLEHHNKRALSYEQALCYQLIGVIYRDSGDTTAATTQMNLSQQYAERAYQEVADESAEQIRRVDRLLAARSYRRASIALQELASAGDNLRKTLLLQEARVALDHAFDHVADDPDVVRAVIQMRRGILFAHLLRMATAGDQTQAFPGVRNTRDVAPVIDALDDAWAIMVDRTDGHEPLYNEQGFLLHASGVLHAKAQVALLFHTEPVDIPAEGYTLEDGMRYVQEAQQDLATLSERQYYHRWLINIQVTEVELYAAMGQPFLAFDKLYRLCDQLEVISSQRLRQHLRQVFERTWHLLNEHVHQIDIILQGDGAA